MKYFEVSRRDFCDFTKVNVNTNDYQPICGINKMRISMEAGTSDYTIVNRVSHMLCYIDAPVRFTFLSILEQYDKMCEWLGANDYLISAINVYITSDYTLEHECVFSFNNMDDFDEFIHAIRNNFAPWYLNCIKIDITDGSQIVLTD